MPRVRQPDDPRPTLVYFASRRSGPSRRVHAFLDQVLQSRRNHETFKRRDIDVDEHPDLARRFKVEELPTIIVVHEGRVARRLEGRVGIPQIRTALAAWLQ
jgi:thioredoxin-like negative regulator of GroEL